MIIVKLMAKYSKLHQNDFELDGKSKKTFLAFCQNGKKLGSSQARIKQFFSGGGLTVSTKISGGRLIPYSMSPIKTIVSSQSY